AIAIALARERCSWQLYASDNSLESLTIAKHNAAQWSADRIIFLCADWLAAFRHQAFDVIVCNPPYIQGGDPHLKDLCHEPASALIANDNGLGDLKRVINASVTAIRPGGHIFLEHGYDQQEIVVDL
ncbi:MAG: methyltransferase, partial [Pseudomonadales bacterium]